MRTVFLRRAMPVFLALVMLGLCFAEADAQRTRNKRSRRITNPVRTSSAPATPGTSVPPTTTATPSNGDARIISTADDTTSLGTQDEEPQPTTTRRTRHSRNENTEADSTQENVRRTVNRLSRQVESLNDKISQMEGQQRALVDLERLSRAEQRAEAFRAQLLDVQAKEVDLQTRLDQIEFDLRPENIERTGALYGTTRPEDVRDARRRQLENERTRIRSQLDLLATSRTRLESAIALADTEVEQLRARLDAQDNGTGNTTTPRTGSSQTTGTRTPPSDTTTTDTDTTTTQPPSGTP